MMKSTVILKASLNYFILFIFSLLFLDGAVKEHETSVCTLYWVIYIREWVKVWVRG